MIAKQFCQVMPDQNTESLNPIILLPASSGISYEALHYPVPLEPYQVIPLVINTGKIPLINHAIQAPIQYFVPNGANQPIPRYDPMQYSTPQHENRPTARQSSIKYSSTPVDNQPTYNYYPPTTMYSETHVGQPSSRYSYGYKIIDGTIGNSNNQDKLRDNTNVPENYILAEPDGTKRIFEYESNPEAGFKTVVHKQKLDNTDRENEFNMSRAIKPIVVRPDLKTMKTELKKHYKNTTTNLETPSNVTNRDRNMTTLKP